MMRLLGWHDPKRSCQVESAGKEALRNAARFSGEQQLSYQTAGRPVPICSTSGGNQTYLSDKKATQCLLEASQRSLPYCA